MYNGDKMTFWQLFKLNGWKIEIPIIQRDYAQGRKSSSEIRSTFLDALYDHLCDSIPQSLDLDFVYGSIKEGKGSVFVPLDGQQRLTTLFLLHWYLSLRDGQQEEFQSMLCIGKHSKFTYETRSSSQEFCDALVFASFDLMQLEPESQEGKCDQLSQTIMDSAWYMRSWRQDPTIQSMLVMVDSIHHRFSKSSGFFEKLIREDNPAITFQFLNLSEFRLTEDLYIKMNSRGKQLTPFENFKAKLEQYIGQNLPLSEYPYKLVREGIVTEVSAKEYFSYKIDTDWANIFWKFRDDSNLFDQQLMNFIRVVITNHVASIRAYEDQDDHLKLLIGKEDPNREDEPARPITFGQYREIGCLSPKLVVELIDFLDLVSEGNGDVAKRLNDVKYYDESRIFVKVIKNNLTFTDRIQFYAFYKYLIRHRTTVGLEDWMRVVYNLTENYYYNRREEFSRSIRSIRNLVTKGDEILAYLGEIKNSVFGFYSWQITEERIKAILFQRKVLPWTERILTFEKHGYFNGQIGFLLSFAGIESHYDNAKSFSWTEEEESQFFESFCDFGAKACAIWGNSGLKPISEFLWERALISKGNYLLSSGANVSFLINHDRDISWKRLLREDNEGKRAFVRELFADSDFDQNKLQKSLSKIIAKSRVNDWRRFFVLLPQTLQSLGEKRFIRWLGEGNTILLLKKSQRNGYHKEYYSFAYYNSEIVSMDIKPFTSCTYHEGIGEEVVPSIELWNWKFKEYNFRMYLYIIFGENRYTVEFSERANKEIPVEITSILEPLSFSAESARMTYTKVSKSNINKLISKLLDCIRGVEINNQDESSQ